MKFQKKGFVSMLLFFAFLVICVSGACLYASPKGRVAHWTNWTLFGVGKEGWEAIHVNVSILLLLASGFHLYFNWTLFLGYIKTKARWALNLKKEIVVAALLVIFIVAGALFYVPPFGTVMDINSQIQAHWERQAPRAPTPHAEEFDLNRLAQAIGLSTNQIVDTLRQEGFVVEDRSMTVREISEKYGVAPSDLYAAITKHHPNLRRGGRRGGGQRGSGQRRGGVKAEESGS